MKKVVLLVALGIGSCLSGMTLEEKIKNNQEVSSQDLLQLIKNQRGLCERLACYTYHVPIRWIEQVALTCGTCGEKFKIRHRMKGFIVGNGFYCHHDDCFEGKFLDCSTIFHLECVDDVVFNKSLEDHFSQQNILGNARFESVAFTFMLSLLTLYNPQIWYQEIGIYLMLLEGFLVGRDEGIDKGQILNWIYFQCCRVQQLCCEVGNVLTGKNEQTWLDPYLYALSAAYGGYYF